MEIRKEAWCWHFSPKAREGHSSGTEQRDEGGPNGVDTPASSFGHKPDGSPPRDSPRRNTQNLPEEIVAREPSCLGDIGVTGVLQMTATGFTPQGFIIDECMRIADVFDSEMPPYPQLPRRLPLALLVHDN